MTRAREAAGRDRDRDPLATAAAVLLALVLAGTALAVDVRAAASFDAPKRLIALVGLAGAAACLLAGGGLRIAMPRIVAGG